jgi:hypothetical protein
MLLLYVFILYLGHVTPQYRYKMYNTVYGQDRYCLLYNMNYDIFIDEELLKLTPHIIPFCLRSEETLLISGFDFNNTIDPNLTFAELREKNISSAQLLSWSASIDLAERYQIFLNNNTSHLSSSENETLFCNCTMPWFGPLCRFTFDIQVIKSLEEIVKLAFQPRLGITSGAKITCYKHLNCQTSFRCLDWREICDRKVECLDGSDEFNCWQPKINECAENEYRCYNGQCIPKKFFNDDKINMDCLDQIDERVGVSGYTKMCLNGPVFGCEEHSCPLGLSFTCGDGKCGEIRFYM